MSELIAPVDKRDPDYRKAACQVCHTRLCVDESTHKCQDCIGAASLAAGAFTMKAVSRQGWTEEEWADHERRILEHA